MTVGYTSPNPNPKTSTVRSNEVCVCLTQEKQLGYLDMSKAELVTTSQTVVPVKVITSRSGTVCNWAWLFKLPTLPSLVLQLKSHRGLPCPALSWHAKAVVNPSVCGHLCCSLLVHVPSTANCFLFSLSTVCSLFSGDWQALVTLEANDSTKLLCHVSVTV